MDSLYFFICFLYHSVVVSFVFFCGNLSVWNTCGSDIHKHHILSVTEFANFSVLCNDSSFIFPLFSLFCLTCFSYIVFSLHVVVQCVYFTCVIPGGNFIH